MVIALSVLFDRIVRMALSVARRLGATYTGLARMRSRTKFAPAGVAFSTLACPGWSLPQVVGAARREGYDGVELRLIDGEVIDPNLPAAERERVRRTFREAGVPVVAVDSSVRVAAAADPAAASAELDRFLELASTWGSSLVRVFGGQWPAGRSRADAFAQARGILERAAPRAEQLGVRVALETHDAFSGAADAAELLDGLPAGVGVIWDTHHPYRVGDSPERVIGLLGDRVLHVHLKDARRAGDGWQLVPLGEGELPLRECLDVLAERGYRGWLCVEWEKKWHPEIAEPEVALPQHLALLRRWLAG
jgi:sugar phosphate isomerase/epimerase